MTEKTHDLKPGDILENTADTYDDVYGPRVRRVLVLKATATMVQVIEVDFKGDPMKGAEPKRCKVNNFNAAHVAPLWEVTVGGAWGTSFAFLGQRVEDLCPAA